MYNTGRMVEFVLVLGEGVKGASLKECEAAGALACTTPAEWWNLF